MWSAARELAERCVGGARFGNWLFMHNGAIAGFSSLQRDLAFAVDPSLYPHIQGTTDSEVLFHLALTLGLREDPSPRWPRPSRWRSGRHEHGVRFPMQGTVAVSDGSTVWAFSSASCGPGGVFSSLVSKIFQ